MSTAEEIYKNVVEKVFNNWTALRLAVEHMGGRNSQQTALEIMNYVYDYCLKSPNIHPSDLQEVLEEIMDQEYDTICDDNSIPEISQNLVKYLKLCQENKFNEVEMGLNQLPLIQYWIGSNTKLAKAEDASSSSDDSESSEDEEMEVDGQQDIQPQESKNATSKSQGVDDDGWTVVPPRRGR